MTAPLLALLDGTLADVATPLVRADDLGVVRGDGVFDATLVRRGPDGVGHVRDREAHLDRLERSAAILQLPEPDRAGFERAIDALVAAWDFAEQPEALIRLVLTRGPESGGAPTAFALMAPLAASAVATAASSKPSAGSRTTGAMNAVRLTHVGAPPPRGSTRRRDACAPSVRTELRRSGCGFIADGTRVC